MIIDAHAHVFPHFVGASGYKDPSTHLMMQQAKVHTWWGRMVTSTMDEQYMPMPGEEVGFRVGKYGRYYWTKNGRECWLQRFPPIMEEMEWPPERMVAFMDSVGVDVAVLQAGYMEMNYCRRYFAECIKKWPGRFVGTVTVDYDIQKGEDYRRAELQKIQDSVLELNMRGVYQGYPKGQEIDDRQFDPFWRELSELGIPHIFLTGFQPKNDYLDSLGRIARVLEKFPDLKIVIGHLGGNVRDRSNPNYTNTPEELMEILRMKNVYFEVGYVLAYENWDVWGNDYKYPYPLHTQLVKKIYDEIGAERMLWASDMPNLYRTCTYLQCLDLVRLHFDFLSPEEKEMVLWKNAAKLFGIKIT